MTFNLMKKRGDHLFTAGYQHTNFEHCYLLEIMSLYAKRLTYTYTTTHTGTYVVFSSLTPTLTINSLSDLKSIVSVLGWIWDYKYWNTCLNSIKVLKWSTIVHSLIQDCTKNTLYNCYDLLFHFFICCLSIFFISFFLVLSTFVLYSPLIMSCNHIYAKRN